MFTNKPNTKDDHKKDAILSPEPKKDDVKVTEPSTQSPKVDSKKDETIKI